MKYLNYRYYLPFLILSLVFVTAQAQYTSDNGCFEINAIEACINGPLTLTCPFSECEFFIGNTNITSPSNFSVDTPGNYVITGVFTDDVCETDQISITIHPDDVPEFDIYRCGSGTVEIRINDENLNYDSYRINWGDGTPETTNSGVLNTQLHTYADATNTYSISVQGLYNDANGSGGCTPGVKDVILTGALPQAQITEIYPHNNQSDQLVIKYNAPDNALYRLELTRNNDSNWIPAQALSADKDSLVMTNISLDQNYYCFRIATLNACEPGNPPAAYSPILCTQILQLSFTNNQENVLNWTTSSINATGFIINQGNTITYGPVPTTRRTFTDTQVDCNVEYCYTLTTNYPNGATVRSLRKCGIAKFVNSPPAVEEMSIQVTDTQLELDWEEPEINNSIDFYNVFVSINGGNRTPAANEVATTEFTDSDRDPVDNAYCYQINYKDFCENTSESSKNFCAIHLRGSVSINIIKLNWNSYNGYTDGVFQYMLEKFDQNNNLLESIILNQTNHSDTLDESDPQQLRYRVTAFPTNTDLENSISNIFTATRRTIYKIPNAFTPGSGDVNSTFKVISPFIEEVEMKIFNRWGEMVFYVNDPANPGWPGTDMDGNLLPQGTYVYTIKLTSESGQQTESKGTVLLLGK